MLFLARIVRLIAALVVAVIVIGIGLHLLGANSGNGLVKLVYDAADPLVSPFSGIFRIRDHDVSIAVHWGLAAVVYAIAGALVARLLAGVSLAARERFGTRGRRPAAL